MGEMGRRERKKIEAKEKIKGAAVKLFLEKGFVPTTIAEIMEEADLGTGTFYNHFSSKEEVINCVVAEEIFTAREKIDHLIHEDASAAEKLEKIILTTCRSFQENKDLITLVMQQIRVQGSGIKPVTHGEAFKEVIFDTIREGQEKGEFNNRVPARVIHEYVHGILQSSIFNSYTEANMEANLKFKIELLFHGIKSEER